MASRLFAVAAFAAVTAVSTLASARELEYSAPASCPSRDAVKERLDRDPGGRDVSISVQQDGATYRGVVALGEGAERLSRTVEARSCAAVLDALLLVAAIDQPPPPPAPPPAAPAVEASPIAPAPPPASTVVDRPSEPPTKEDPDARSLVTFGGGVGSADFANRERFSSFFVMGEIMPDVRLFGVSWMRPSFQLRLSRSLTTEITNLPEKTSFTLTSASLDACPFSNLKVTDWFSFNFCTRGEAGALGASSAGGSATRGWLMVAPVVVRAPIHFTKKSLRPHLMLDWSFGFPIVRERFRVIDETVRANALVFSGSLAFGVTLP